MLVKSCEIVGWQHQTVEAVSIEGDLPDGPAAACSFSPLLEQINKFEFTEWRLFERSTS